MFDLTRLLAGRKHAVHAADDSLGAFLPEGSSAAPESQAGPRQPRWQYLGALALVGVTGAGGVGTYLLKKAEPLKAAAPSASLTIESDPVGAVVTAHGVRQGVTPLTLLVAPGEHPFEIVHGERRKEIRVVARAETALVHHVEFDLAAPEETKGSAAADDSAPVAAPALVKPAAPSARIPPPAGPAAGWLAITSPIPLQIVEKSQVIGSTAAPKIMVPAGKRDLQLVNESLGFAERRVVQVEAGKTASISVTVPKAPISINAVPWAEVWIDGVRVGETPIGNYLVRLGSRDIVFRHPELGERRRTAVVSLTAPARVSVDMRKEQ
jgi:hypothetical protein